MKKRNALAFLLILGLLVVTLAACGGIDGPAGIGHRYGNPEVSYADGKVTIKYLCVDCEYYELEEREAATQVSDAQAWYEAFGKLDESKYSLSVIETSNGEVVTQKHFVISDDRGYYASVEPEELHSSGECYTLQKKDESFITYVISDEEGAYLADETDNRYWVQMKKESYFYLALEDKFDQFIYNAQSGSYVTTAPMDVEMFGFDGESLGATTFQSVAVNIVDGNICRIDAGYTMVDEYLQEIQIDLCFYNIGFSVVKVPQSVIDEVTGNVEPTDPDDYLGYFTYEIKNDEVTIKQVDTAISGDITIPAVVGGFPVVAIGENTFQDCSKLTGITIPGSIVRIGNNAFLGCEALKNVVYAGTQAGWEGIAISEIGNTALLNAVIHFADECEHSYDEGVVTLEPTCGADGIKTYTCSLCGTKKTERLTMLLSHSYDDSIVIEDPTCSDAGMKIYTCTGCGKNKTEYIPKLTAHTYTNGTCIHCGADDPKYVDDTDKEVGGLLGAFIQLFESIFKIFSFFG